MREIVEVEVVTVVAAECVGPDVGGCNAARTVARDELSDYGTATHA